MSKTTTPYKSMTAHEHIAFLQRASAEFTIPAKQYREMRKTIQSYGECKCIILSGGIVHLKIKVSLPTRNGMMDFQANYQGFQREQDKIMLKKDYD